MSFAKQASSVSVELQKIPVWAKNPILILGASILIGLFAYVSFPLPFTPIPIATQPFLVLFLAVLVGSKRATAAVAAFLLQGAGFDIRAILSPTVPKGSERVRICLHSFNTENEIRLLTEMINNLLNAQ